MYSELHAIFGESVGNEFVPRKSIQPVLLSVRQYLRIKDGIAAVRLPVDIHPAFKGGNRGRTCKYIIWKRQGAFLVRRLSFQQVMNYYIIYNIKNIIATNFFLYPITLTEEGVRGVRGVRGGLGPP
jgi:hypothetical protein